ncbi:helix-turn-helix domain-containing protein [Actinacidiphila paucisporea]|uniref:Helix-turn-helix domain-containing protein n=1 Tax=Actinacidiphila paucisporea TaxID=310782 RepID=A0A1M7IRC2_9ACTN|nr:helix-turn-helix transcriptional regulator [Actinacidiphila paucisporea]SHM43261.1 Helix-turn-helix domain-containing protein [Actinacidiphila paucisporea]
MTARSHLAPVLRQLHRARGMPLRALAARLGIPAADTAAILSGERFPGWSLTERFAQACGADPLVLRKVWEDARLRSDPHHRLDLADTDSPRSRPA